MTEPMQLTPQQIDRRVAQLFTDKELAPQSIDEVVKLPSFLSKMTQCAQLFQTSYSRVDHAVQDALVLRRLQQMFNTLMLNPLWRERIEHAGLTQAPRNFEEWQQLPVSDKTAMQDVFMGTRPGLVVPLSHGDFQIVASGGTSTGSPVEMVYSLRELHDTYKLAGQFMGHYMLPAYLTGDEPKWMMTTLYDHQMWSSGTMVGGVLQEIPQVNYISAGPVSKEVFQHMLGYPGPKAIMSTSQGITFLPELADGLNETARRSLQTVIYGSGLLPQRILTDLKTLFPEIDILSYFATVQNETIGLQLEASSPYLTTVPGLHLVEVVNENGRWVEEGEEGELVVTRLHGHESPFPRFKSNDRAIRRANITLNGLNAQQFEFVGRSGDIIHVRNVHYLARQVYAALCRGLKSNGLFDLDEVAHEVQFVNDRATDTLSLLAAVDNPQQLNSQLHLILGIEGIRRVFMESLLDSVSIFNRNQANTEFIKQTGYSFVIKMVQQNSAEIYRTTVGKTPIIRDVF